MHYCWCCAIALLHWGCVVRMLTPVSLCCCRGALSPGWWCFVAACAMPFWLLRRCAIFVDTLLRQLENALGRGACGSSAVAPVSSAW